MSIFIFSGPVRSGKTTALFNWSIEKEDVAGILMPDSNGKRKILDIRSQNIFDIECDDPVNSKEALVKVGRFSFYENAFKKANAILMRATELDPGWLIIDEVGKLELDRKGFFESVKEITEMYLTKKNNGRLLLVVRNSLCAEVISFFKLKDYQIINELP